MFFFSASKANFGFSATLFAKVKYTLSIGKPDKSSVALENNLLLTNILFST